MRIDRVEQSLLAQEHEVVRERSDAPVSVGSILPRVKSEGDTGPLPTLIMAPPAEVRALVPKGLLDSVLHVAAGFDTSAYEADGVPDVRFEVVYDGRTILDEWRPAGLAQAREDRSWRRLEIPVESGGELVLRTSLRDEDAGVETAPVAGFALLEVVAPHERPRTRATPEQPNVVVICIDTLRADRMSTYGHDRPTSPTMDALAERGTLFETAYSATPWTWPSTASLFTALTPPEHGLLDVDSCYLAHTLTTLAEALFDAGLSTAGFSCNPLVAANKNFDQGFESFNEYDWANADVVWRDVEPWLEEHGEYRFFLYLHLTEPHRPYEPAPELAARFAGEAPEGYSDTACRPLLDAMSRGEEYDRDRLQALLDHRIGLYDAEIAMVDASLAELFERFRAMGLEDRTIFAVTSDHGEEFAEHGMLGHGKQLFDESVRVPLFLAGPGVPAGQRVAVPVENRHLAATLLALAGVEPHANLDEVDLLDSAELERAASDPIFFSVKRGQSIAAARGGRFPLPDLCAVQRGPLRLFWSATGDGSGSDWFALYDLERDADAATDLAGERPVEVGAMRGLIEAWLEEGEKVRPRVEGGSEADMSRLRGLGYIDGDDH